MLDYIAKLNNKNNYDNFYFLEEDFPELYKTSQKIEQYYSIDSSCCLLKIRLFTELWCHEVDNLIKVNLSLRDFDLKEKIDKIANSNGISKYIINILHKLRKEGNRSAHITRNVSGKLESDVGINNQQLSNLVKYVHEIAKYLAFTLQGKSDEDVEQWQEIHSENHTMLVSDALKGDGKASFTIAISFFHGLKILSQFAKKNPENTSKFREYQRDFIYWLDKAEYQGNNDAWLLYARAYADKFILLPKDQNISEYFNKAIKYDTSGEAEWFFYQYLTTRGNNPKAIEFLKKSADKGYYSSLFFMRKITFEKDLTEYQSWLEKSLKHEEPLAKSSVLYHRLNQFVTDTNNIKNFRKLKKALIDAEARRNIAGTKFIRAYCDYYGYITPTKYSQDEAVEIIVNSYRDLPQYLNYEYNLFKLVMSYDDQKYFDVLNETFELALRQADDEIEKANMKFDVGYMAYKILQETGSVKTTFNLKGVIKEASVEGSEKAINFMNSDVGKAFIRNDCVRNIPTKFKSINRKKQKQARKQARKNRRK